MLTKEEILDTEYKRFIKEKGVESVWPPAFPEAYKEAALNAVEEYANQGKWISVKDRLPENRSNEGWSHSLDVNILYEDNVVSTGSYRYLNIKEWADYLYNKRDKKVTHWQPLPTSPKQ